jgi:hypothetical protein
MQKNCGELSWSLFSAIQDDQSVEMPSGIGMHRVTAPM